MLMVRSVRKVFSFSTVRFFVQSEVDPQARVEVNAAEGKHKIPLAFECGFDCACSTCSVKLLSPEDFNKLQLSQPQSQEEKNVLKNEGKLGRYSNVTISECVSRASQKSPKSSTE